MLTMIFAIRTVCIFENVKLHMITRGIMLLSKCACIFLNVIIMIYHDSSKRKTLSFIKCARLCIGTTTMKANISIRSKSV